jgi:hypothetical protein
MLIPLILNSSWHLGEYSKIPPNKVMLENNQLKVEVSSSASPLFYAFDRSRLVKGFKISGNFLGFPKMKDYNLQGTKGFDDYPLRIGFVIKGDKKLNYVSRLIAPEWLKKMYQSLPEGKGIDRIEFFNVTQNANELNISRTHPSSKLINETIFASTQKIGEFTYQYKVPSEFEVEAIWISIDGDDTKSKFSVVINEFGLF